MLNLSQRIRKVEEKLDMFGPDDDDYKKALKKYYSGKDNGEALARLPSLAGTEPKYRLALLCIHALHELDMEKVGK